MWLIECDKVENYKKYFPEGNSSNLEYTFAMRHRPENLQEAQGKGKEKSRKKHRTSINKGLKK
jgi:hypothetical protein